MEGNAAATYINGLYANICQGIHRNMNKARDRSDMKMRETKMEFKFNQIGEYYVVLKYIRYIRTLIKENKTTRVTGINSQLLKKCLHVWSFELIYLYIMLIYTQICPDAWKQCHNCYS